MKAEKPLTFQVTENQFQAAVIEMAERLGWEVWHDNDSRRNAGGLPDLICVHADHGVIWLELKTMKGRIRPRQQYWLDLLTVAGQRAHLVRPDAMDVLEAMFRGEAVDSAQEAA